MSIINGPQRVGEVSAIAGHEPTEHIRAADVAKRDARTKAVSTRITSRRRPAEPPLHVDSEGMEIFRHLTHRALLVDAYKTRKAAEALCGNEWTPSGDPSPYSLCPDCRRVLNTRAGICGI